VAVASDVDEATVIRAPRETAPAFEDVEATMMRAPNLVPDPSATTHGTPSFEPSVAPAAVEVKPAPRRRALWIVLSLLIVAALVVASVVAINMLNSDATRPKPAETELVDPQDVVSAAVPRVTDVTAVTNDGQVTFTWQNPAPETGDSYLWYSVSLDGQGKPELLNEASVSVPEVAGQTCIEVILRRENGRSSDPVRGCTP